jgi:hypothetical protein
MTGNSIKTGDAIGSVLTAGDRNRVNVTTWKASELTQPVDNTALLAALAALKADLQALSTNPALVGASVDEATELAKQDDPPKDKVGDALRRAVEYAGSAEKLAESGSKLWPTLKTIATWLGAAAPIVLKAVGISLI